MRPVIVVHYHEIALKGRNRNRFELQLIANLRAALRGMSELRVQRMSGRIVVRLASSSPHAFRVRALVRLARVFGIANFLSGFEVRQSQSGIVEDTVAVVREHLSTHPVHAFAVRAKRSRKDYPETSAELERRLGAVIQAATGLRVDLEQPELTVAVEVVERTAFVLLEKVAGPGGLPVSVSGGVVALLSSGFDSPVAAWMLMKRGCPVTFVHFHSYPYTSDTSMQNVRAIVERLSAWQGVSVLVTVPLIDLQKRILTGAPHALRVLLYRRAMVRIAELVAARARAGALVTGESLGQVASQTLPNIAVVEAAAALPIFRPLIGFDKQEIIARAEAIGTAEISRRPYEDCCSLFTPSRPATRARGDVLERVEEDLQLHAWTPKLFDLATWETIRPDIDG